VTGEYHKFRPRQARQLAALSDRAAEMAQAARDDKDERDAALNVSRALHIAASLNGNLEDARRWLAETARPDLRERAFGILRELTGKRSP
jgi:hypothetical protein